MTALADTATDWAARVVQLRQALGETQEDFGRRIGVERHTIQQWEAGRATPRRPAQMLLEMLAREQAGQEGATP